MRRAVRRLGGRGRRDALDALVARNDEADEVTRRAQERFVTRLGFGELLHVRGAVGTGPVGGCARSASWTGPTWNTRGRDIVTKQAEGAAERPARGRGRRPADEVRADVFRVVGEVLLKEAAHRPGGS
jgi:hypothetical protein